MIGILSTKSKMQAYSKDLFSSFGSVINNRSKSMIIVFTLYDIDFSNKTVYGNLIKKDNMEMCRVPIPDIIFNLSYYQKNSNKKKIKLLAEQDNVILINEVNQFSQNMIMEMLYSSPQIKPMLLNYSMYNGEKNSDELLKKEDILVLPEKGSASLKTMWIKKDSQKERNIDQNSDLPNIFALDSKLSKKKWIFFDAPDLLTHENQPVLITLHVQRCFGGTWRALTKKSGSINEKIEAAAIEITKYLSCFIPSLAFCTVTFVLDKNFTPFLINIRGWDPSLLRGNKKNDMHDSFIKNLFYYYDFLKVKQKGGINFVG